MPQNRTTDADTFYFGKADFVPEKNKISVQAIKISLNLKCRRQFLRFSLLQSKAGHTQKLDSTYGWGQAKYCFLSVKKGGRGSSHEMGRRIGGN